MHIQPGVVTGAKLLLSYATAAGALTVSAKLALEAVKERGLGALALRSAVATGAVFSFFQILPHVPVGVSEVHLILGTSLLLMLGVAPAAIGLALGLLVQGLFFAPFDHRAPQAATAPATVCGERLSTRPLGQAPGRRKAAATRESGDRPCENETGSPSGVTAKEALCISNRAS